MVLAFVLVLSCVCFVQSSGVFRRKLVSTQTEEGVRSRPEAAIRTIHAAFQRSLHGLRPVRFAVLVVAMTLFELHCYHLKRRKDRQERIKGACNQPLRERSRAHPITLTLPLTRNPNPNPYPNPNLKILALGDLHRSSCLRLNVIVVVFCPVFLSLFSCLFSVLLSWYFCLLRLCRCYSASFFSPTSCCPYLSCYTLS